MLLPRVWSVAFAVSLLAAACASSGTHAGPPADGGGGSVGDGGPADAGDAGDAGPTDSGDADAEADAYSKSLPCVGTFGSALTAAFGRLDGTVVAVLPPDDQSCPDPNSTHLILEVRMGGDVYRMVVDVLSSTGNPEVGIDEIDAPLTGSAWADGWHTGIPLDYVTTLGVHSTSFTPTLQADLVGKITAEIDLGAHISVFATSGGAADEPDSAHLVHRNLTNADGAIVIHPDGAKPHYILLAFADQTF